jgi:MbtH protein
MAENQDREEKFLVVVNDEERHAIWPARLAVPGGWRQVGTPGPKPDCLAYIEKSWTDMRPKSLRVFLDSAGGSA